MRPVLQGGPRPRVLLVLLPGVFPRPFPFLEVRLVAAAEDVDLSLGEVELDDPGDGPGEELPVVADDDDPGPLSPDEGLQPVEAVEVEVVGRLVEEEDVVAGEQQRGQADPRGLAAGQGGHPAVQVDPLAEGEAQVGEHAGGTLLEIGTAEGEEGVEGVGIGVVGSRGTGGERVGRRVEGGPGPVHPGPPCEEGRDRLAGEPVRLLGEVAHLCRRW